MVKGVPVCKKLRRTPKQKPMFKKQGYKFLSSSVLLQSLVQTFYYNKIVSLIFITFNNYFRKTNVKIDPCYY